MCEVVVGLRKSKLVNELADPQLMAACVTIDIVDRATLRSAGSSARVGSVHYRFLIPMTLFPVVLLLIISLRNNSDQKRASRDTRVLYHAFQCSGVPTLG